MKGSLIKQHRKFKNMTLEELATGICSVSYLSKIEHNSINASDEIYRLIGERLNIKLTDINQEFDERIYQKLLDWHEAIQLKDNELIEELSKECEQDLQENHNIELSNLYTVIQVRQKMTTTYKPISKNDLNKLENILHGSSSVYQFLYFKTLGIHYLLTAQPKDALHQFLKAKKVMDKIPFQDYEVFFHLALAYSKTRSFVESTYYAQEALEGYQKSFNYSKMIDNYLIIAINYNSLNAYHIAEEYLLKILKLAKYHIPETEKRRIYHNLGINYINQEKFEKAYHYLFLAYEIDTKESSFMSSTIYLLALTSFYSGDRTKCMKYIEEGEKEAKKHGFTKYKHKFYILRNMLQESTHTEEFINKLENEIIPTFRELNEYKDYKYFVEMLASIFYEKRLYKKSAMYFKEANNYQQVQKKDLL
ncbi:helix-turn-helix domain-containing protein [Halobacillus yeomjeoni]|uniref:Helix-turn-helix transcriptional regulator n=1 Tax=Halobacillus yeomjeoni TaxID=311194 RepID=A0A931HVY4_9BACI|nr:helix-turn-helix transcriptional regulator [Halobacillus yeomjeoni]MBH0230421.1 helix-turn-helix transcriptional regulator [Halobacillus yeomjeoni]MCA0985306.1 helix-turn-helix domain-containing protein [Halobacillus yeomjeoni]